MLMTYIEKIQHIISTANVDAMSHEEYAVLCVVYEAWTQGKKVTQRDIARSERWLGVHPVHETHVQKKTDTTLRKVRQIIRDLRTVHGMPILSDRKGYWMPRSESEAKDYLERIEGLAKAQSAAWFETYSAMQKTLGITSEFFEMQRSLFTSDARQNF